MTKIFMCVATNKDTGKIVSTTGCIDTMVFDLLAHKAPLSSFVFSLDDKEGDIVAAHDKCWLDYFTSEVMIRYDHYKKVLLTNPKASARL